MLSQKKKKIHVDSNFINLTQKSKSTALFSNRTLWKLENRCFHEKKQLLQTMIQLFQKGQKGSKIHSVEKSQFVQKSQFSSFGTFLKYFQMWNFL